MLCATVRAVVPNHSLNRPMIGERDLERWTGPRRADLDAGLFISAESAQAVIDRLCAPTAATRPLSTAGKDAAKARDRARGGITPRSGGRLTAWCARRFAASKGCDDVIDWLAVWMIDAGPKRVAIADRNYEPTQRSRPRYDEACRTVRNVAALWRMHWSNACRPCPFPVETKDAPAQIRGRNASLE